MLPYVYPCFIRCMFQFCSLNITQSRDIVKNKKIGIGKGGKCTGE